MHTTTELQLPDQTVKPIAKGVDCTAMVLGLSYGTNSINVAMQHGYMRSDRDAEDGRVTIHRVHSIALVDTIVLGVGNRCLRVEGEP